ncbi:hypothetical protein EGT68_010110 [Acinetobacter junii]|uniref:major capsid protein n=1 Tax=Acinetobacter junii TaxID=40215 RepID=UPI000F676FA2|nr:major capsid protein [Acinetobacter junii]QXR09860.1 hypothetical protein EGT68_010110 [Acinetobacter junii]
MTEQQKLGLAQVQVKKQSRFQTYLNRGAVVATVATATGAASAAYDVTEILDNLALAVTAAATIGVAWLGFTAGIAIWRNLRAAAK